jgi:hypothetical protein
MKYLKKFESSNDEILGVTPEDIKYLFTDISDNGWTVHVRFLKKLFDFTLKPEFKDTSITWIDGNVYSSTGSDLKFGLIPYIQVSISKPTPFEQRNRRSKWVEIQELNDYINSEDFKEIIEVVSLRLNDLGLYIKSSILETTDWNNKIQFNIFIYRKTDENYIK